MGNPLAALFGNRTIIVNQGFICMGNTTHGDEQIYASKEQVALISTALLAIARSPLVKNCQSMEDAVETMENLAQGKPTTMSKLRTALGTMGTLSHTIAEIKALIDSFTVLP